MRWDLRICLSWVVRLIDVGGHGCVGSVLLSYCVICGTDGSSSLVRVYRRWICDRWCAWACVCLRTGIAPW